MRFRALLRTALWVGCAAIGASFIVPDELPETEIYLSEEFRSSRLSATGESLIVRSSQYDYQFALPPNELDAAFALRLDERMECSLRDPVFDAETGEAAIDFEVFYGRYDKALDKDVRSTLAHLGFMPSPSNIQVIGVEGPELYMVWGQGSGLKGKRFLPGTLQEPTGQDVSECIRNDGLYVTVKLDAETIRKNRLTNTLFFPFHAIREGIQGCLFFILVMLFGWSGSP